VVHLSPAGHLGVPRHDAHARPGGGLLHGRGDLLQLIHGEALLDDEGAGQIKGLRAHAAQVVHRAADAELADVAAGELPGRDDEAVGGEGQTARLHGEHGGVVRREIRIAEVGLEHLIDELGGLGPARAVGQGHSFILDHYSLPPY
jgi:hypothetical protein